MLLYGLIEGVLLYGKLCYLFSGVIYERCADGYVHVIIVDGCSGCFIDQGTRVDGDFGQVDLNMCDWIGGMQLFNVDSVLLFLWFDGDVLDFVMLRKMVGDLDCVKLRLIIGDVVDQVSDVELCDSIYLMLFLNFYLWGLFNQIVYCFCLYGDDFDQCVYECMYFLVVLVDGLCLFVVLVYWFGLDDDWVEVFELGMLVKVFNQDVHNMFYVQVGLKVMKQLYVMFGDYGETKFCYFYKFFQEWIDKL